MGGGGSAEGFRMQASNSTTYPVFLRSINPSGGGETSAWIFKEADPSWGIWHNNPINTLDITRASATGIENNVGGGTNTVMIRLSHSDGSGQFTGNILNRVGSTILDQSGNIPGNAATVGSYAASDFIRKGENVDTALGDSTDNRATVLTLNNTHTCTFTANSDIGDGRRVFTVQNPTSNTGNGIYTAMQFQIVGDVGSNRTMGDLKFVRDSSRRGLLYFYSTDSSGNWNDSL
jgi:hypothetical protein